MQGEREIMMLANEEMKAAVQTEEQPQKEKCPRCESFNTKFCYYNNYSLSQPRYFCKTCRRYWTQGGTLRNVPIGGGCRKGKRPKTSSSSSAGQSQPSPEIQRNKISSTTDPIMNTTSSLSASRLIESRSFSSSCYPGGGYLPIQSLNQSQIFNNQSVGLGGVDVTAGALQPSGAGVTVYSFGPDHNWPSDQSFPNNSNLMVSDASTWTINDTTATSAGNNSRLTPENSLPVNLDQWSSDLPGYGHGNPP